MEDIGELNPGNTGHETTDTLEGMLVWGKLNWNLKMQLNLLQ